MAAGWLREDDFTCMGDKRESLDPRVAQRDSIVEQEGKKLTGHVF
jgi:hypothetical protein